MNLVRVVAVLVVPTCTLTAQLFFRAALERTPLQLTTSAIWRLITNPYLIGGVIVQGIGFVLWLYLLTRLQLAEVIGMAGATVYVLAPIVGYWIYGETLRPLQIVGLAAIVFGIFALTFGAS